MRLFASARTGHGTQTFVPHPCVKWKAEARGGDTEKGQNNPTRSELHHSHPWFHPGLSVGDGSYFPLDAGTRRLALQGWRWDPHLPAALPIPQKLVLKTLQAKTGNHKWGR